MTVASSSQPQSQQQDPDALVRMGGWLFRQRSWLPLPIALALVLLPSPPLASPFLVWSGVALVASGELLRLWAVRHIGGRLADQERPPWTTRRQRPVRAAAQPVVFRKHRAVGRICRERGTRLVDSAHRAAARLRIPRDCPVGRASAGGASRRQLSGVRGACPSMVATRLAGQSRSSRLKSDSSRGATRSSANAERLWRSSQDTCSSGTSLKSEV